MGGMEVAGAAAGGAAGVAGAAGTSGMSTKCRSFFLRRVFCTFCGNRTLVVVGSE